MVQKSSPCIPHPQPRAKYDFLVSFFFSPSISPFPSCKLSGTGFVLHIFFLFFLPRIRMRGKKCICINNQTFTRLQPLTPPPDSCQTQPPSPSSPSSSPFLCSASTCFFSFCTPLNSSPQFSQCWFTWVKQSCLNDTSQYEHLNVKGAVVALDKP